MKKAILLMCMLAVAIVGHAQNTVEQQGIRYLLIDSTLTATVTKGTNQKEAVIIDSITHEGKTYVVTGIAARAFKGCNRLQTVHIPESVSQIGDNAFAECYSLSKIYNHALTPQPINIRTFSMIDLSRVSLVVSDSVVGLYKENPIWSRVKGINIPSTAVQHSEPRHKDSISNSRETHISVETPPSFPGGTKALLAFLDQHIEYPHQARNRQQDGRAVCSFVVSEDGSVTDIEVVRSSGSKWLDQEAVRVIKLMPKWTPGKSDGQPVKVKYTLSVNFRDPNKGRNPLW